MEPSAESPSGHAVVSVAQNGVKFLRCACGWQSSPHAGYTWKDRAWVEFDAHVQEAGSD